jgi:hypothetical protein
MRRWIVWWPVIVEVYENRLSPLMSRDYVFRYWSPKKLQGLMLRASVNYHIMTESQYRRLQTKYGLSVEVPHVFTIYKQEIRLDEPLPVTTVQIEPPSQSCQSKEG